GRFICLDSSTRMNTGRNGPQLGDLSPRLGLQAEPVRQAMDSPQLGYLPTSRPACRSDEHGAERSSGPFLDRVHPSSTNASSRFCLMDGMATRATRTTAMISRERDKG